MRSLCAIGMSIAVLCACMVFAACAAGKAKERNGQEEFTHVYYFPPSDPHTGALLDDAASLLAAARQLPSEVGLWEGRSRRRQTGQGKQKVRPGWVSIEESPVVSLQKLAHTYFRAEKYEKAASCYRRLRKDNPEKKHYKTMQVLCSRLAKGSDQNPSAPTSDDKLDGADEEWVQWMERVDRLHRSLDQGGAR